MLLIERNATNRSVFHLKTNKYVGPRAEDPSRLYELDVYEANSQKFQRNAWLFPDKLPNLQGRELIVAVVDYKPSVIVKRVRFFSKC